MAGPVTRKTQPISFQEVTKAIHVFRSQNVLLDHDLAVLYGVETRALIQAVKRNADRFPPDFTFQLNVEEFAALTSQTVISRPRGRRRQ
jgi:hypothetical protein